MTTSNTYDYLNRLAAISSVSSGSSVVNYQYQYNSANQRTAVTDVDNTYWTYGYDSLGQVTNAVKKWPDNSVVAGQQFGYGFDTIGNRKMTLAGGDQNGANQRLASYTANSLNEYASRTVPGAVDIIGSATNTASVWVDQTLAYRKTNYFWLALPIPNTSGAVYQTVTTLAALPNGWSAEYGTTNIGHVFLPQTPETYGFDLDGNQTSDGRWNYGSDAENRLTNMTSLSGGPAGSLLKLDFTYDYMGRRIQKIVSTNNGSSWVYSYTNKFVYDGWNVVAILDGGNNLLDSFIWGLDLSGSPQGAGGVGGLISMRVYGGASAGTYFYCYDGNGNVTALVNAANGIIAGQYEYGGFGELIRATGPLASVNPFLFSTKYRDSESGFYYYGFRYYNPSNGRWLSRDPAEEEEGGPNLYANCQNDLVDNADWLGLEWLVRREHEARAKARASEATDTIFDLARMIGLDPTQYKKWLQPPDDPISICKTYTIPNEVVVVVGKLGFWPGPRKRLERLGKLTSDILYGKGFMVQYFNREVQTFSADTITGFKGPDLYGYAFFGHGTTAIWPIHDPSLGGDFKIDKDNILTSAEMKNTFQFDYGLGIAYLCSAPFGNWQSIVSPFGHFWGTSGYYQVNGGDVDAVEATLNAVK
ncbi:MAG: RHS repeat-associated core domain-containing protein [Verrucomicrobiota bacterium]